MKRLRIVLAIMLVAGVVLIPTTAQAHECSTIEGHGMLDFSVAPSQGKARVEVDGVRQVVPYVGTGFIETGENTAILRFVWFFDEGTLVVVENSTTTPIGGPLLAFESDVDIKKGGSGGMHWAGIVDLSVGSAVYDITGEICFDR